MVRRSATRRRRFRLLKALENCRLDEAYLYDRQARKDLDREASLGANDCDALLNPAMLCMVRALIKLQLKARTMVPRINAPPSAAFPIAGPAARLDPTQHAERVVVIVPGCMTSSLYDVAPGGYGWIWANAMAFMQGELVELALAPYDGQELDADGSVQIAPRGTLLGLYDKLAIRLRLSGCDIIMFPYDWRKDIDFGTVANRLELLLLGLQLRYATVDVVAHSLGALVARRALQSLGVNRTRRVKHLILLGPANYGSFDAALAGSFREMNLFKVFPEPKPYVQRVVATLSALYQILPWDPVRTPSLTNASHNVGLKRFWEIPIDTRRLVNFYGWGKCLKPSFFRAKTTIILGDNHGRPTTGGVVFRRKKMKVDGNCGMPGDGMVPHACATLPGTKAYIAHQTEHVKLAMYRRVIKAIIDVLADRKPQLPTYP
jgi:hypothetical protein